jgi:hypothetical protein
VCTEGPAQDVPGHLAAIGGLTLVGDWILPSASVATLSPPLNEE